MTTDENKKSSGEIAKKVRCGIYLESLKLHKKSNHVVTILVLSKSFQIHKQLGVYGKFLVPLHVGGALTHYVRGHTIFNRVNPFAMRPKY